MKGKSNSAASAAYKKQIKSASKPNLEEAKLYAFADFLSNFMKDK